LISKTVIVSDLATGQEVRWENLQQVWAKQKDRGAFEAYVVDAVRHHQWNPITAGRFSSGGT
jgi:hypothetical protein